MTEYSVHIVIDVGSSSCKAGFNGENAPRVVMPTVTGKSKNENLNIIDGDKLYIGKEALNNSNNIKLEYPMRNGLITDFDKMEKVWTHLFYNELKTKPEARNVFLTESLYTSNKDREKIAEIMFEKFSIFNIHMEPQPITTLYSTPKTSGLIIESGESMTQIVPIFENYIIPQGIRTTHIAGASMTMMLEKKLLGEFKKYNVGNTSLLTKKVKEKHLEIKLNHEHVDNKSFELPDGNIINVGNERIEIPEIMFNGTEFPSIHQLVHESIDSIDIHLRKDMLNSIVLGGGNSMIKNFPERMKQELMKTFGKDDESIKINSQQERLYSAWIGASVVCSIGNFQHMWLSKNDFEEVGHNIVHKKYGF